jgi:hypothetical protein
MKMDRKKLSVLNNKQLNDSEYVDLPESERLSMVWDLTAEVFSLSGEYDVESRLQRHVINVIRK